MSGPGVSESRRVPPILIAIFIILISLSLIVLYQAVNAYIVGNGGDGNYFAMLGVSTLILAVYLLFQTKRRTPRVIFTPQRVSTTIECKKCGFKNIREFQNGDYIFREIETCPKCNENMMISSIYRESKEKKEKKI